MTWVEWVMLGFLGVLYVATAIPRRRIQGDAEARQSNRSEKASSALRP